MAWIASHGVACCQASATLNASASYGFVGDTLRTTAPIQFGRVPVSRKQNVASPHSASDGFSPLFSNATSDQHSPAPRSTDTASTQKRSERNGDHHLTFLDVADSVPADR